MPASIFERGRVYYTYLNQGEYWVPKDGKRVTISSMNPHWRLNAAHWLERHAANFELLYSAGELNVLSTLIPCVIDEVNGEPVYHGTANLLPTPVSWAEDAFERELDRRHDNPTDWIVTTKLYQALIAF